MSVALQAFSEPRVEEMTAANNVVAYGGVLIDSDKRILLRRPANDFDGYVWTFPKGRSDPEETAEETALRELKEETGYSARIVARLPGDFRGGTTITQFFLMTPVGSPVAFDSSETSQTRWATFSEAEELIAMTTNVAGKQREVVSRIRNAISSGRSSILREQAGF